MSQKPHYNIQNLNVHISSQFFTVCMGLLFLLFLPVGSVFAQQAPKAAGQVTLLIGDVKVSRAGEAAKPLALHEDLYVGDLIESADSGHVQIRFIDNGVISLRPKSRLQIDQYDVDTQNAKKSAIRLNLQQGVIRSISGEATEAAHERFRLNTPITAIGVLGTDFLVKAENDKVLAAVYSGAIAIAPLNAACSAQGLGPCQGAYQLDASSNTILFEQQGGAIHQKLLEHKSQMGSDTNGAAQPSSQTVAVDTGNYLFKDAEAIMAKLKSEPISPIDGGSPFAWGRWTGDVIPSDTMTQTFAQARQGKEVLFYGDHFLLFRTPVSNNNLFPTQASYNFNLAQSEVIFQYNSLPIQTPVVLPAQLNSASLQINFANNQFVSHFQMQVPNVIPVTNLDVSGVVSNVGLLTGGSSGNSVQGALNANADSAALMFEKSVSAGVFQGISNWVRP